MVFDGVNTSLLWDESTDAWVYQSNGPATPMQNRYQMIPTLFRGVNIIANAVATMPFKVYKAKGDKEIDNSAEYSNAMGFLPSPRQTFGLVSMSLDLSGRSYLRPTKNQAGYSKLLAYQNPTTIEPKIENGVLTGWERSENGQTKHLKVEEIVYMWLADPYVELGPPTAYPAQAAFSAASVLGNMDSYIALYFERGAIRPVIVSVKGMAGKEERERMETWFKKLMGGIKRAFDWKIFNADTMDIQQIGDGLESLQDTELTASKRQDVAHALGIPYAVLFSEAANYATAKADQIALYQQTIEPRCEFIASCLNTQLLIPAGYRMEFMPESLDIYQEDEAERATSLAAYVNVGMPMLMACDILGVELTDEQRTELEAEKVAKEERRQEMAELARQKPEEEEPENTTTTQPPQFRSMSGDMRSELSKWYKVSSKALRAGKPQPEFESIIIPPGLHGAISGALEEAKEPDDLKRVFADLFQEH